MTTLGKHSNITFIVAVTTLKTWGYDIVFKFLGIESGSLVVTSIATTKAKRKRGLNKMKKLQNSESFLLEEAFMYYNEMGYTYTHKNGEIFFTEVE